MNQIAELKTTKGTLHSLAWNWQRNSKNPMHCGKRTYKLFISRRQNRVHVGYYCVKCHAHFDEAGSQVTFRKVQYE